MSRRADWPKTLSQPMYGNFRPSVTERAALKAPAQWRKARPGMSPQHLDLVRKLPCTVCEAISRIDPHHLKSSAAAKERGVFLKATDRWAVPVCRFHHDEVERLGSRNERAWFDRWGIDPHDLANALWAATGDLARMGRVLIAHKQGALRELGRRAQVNVLVAHGLTRAEAEEQYEFTRNGRR